MGVSETAFVAHEKHDPCSFPRQMSFKAIEFAVEQSLSDLLFLVKSQERPVPLPEKILVPPKRK